MSERPLWAPWQLEHVAGAKDGECVFCAAARDADESHTAVVDRGQACFSMLNAYPYASGHVTVVPYRHVAGLEQLDDDELTELMHLARRAVAAAREALGAHGVNVGLNLGSVAGAGFAEHLHLHVVPRWEGDNNFMPVIGQTGVISQVLDATREALAELSLDVPRGRPGG